MPSDEPGPKAEIITDPAIFAERVDPVVRRDPVRCSVLATNLQAAIRDGAVPGSQWILISTAGRPVLGGMIIPPHPLWLTPVLLPSADPGGHGPAADPGGHGPAADPGGLHPARRLDEHAAQVLATRLLRSGTGQGPGRRLAGVRGVVGTAVPFARTWQRLTGRRHEVRMAQRMFELTRLIEPADVPGLARPADHLDRNLCVDWMHAFHTEALPAEEQPDVIRIVERRIAHGGFTLWIDAGVPVALAGTSTVVAGVARIGPVYTPPHLRGRGYGGAVTAAASRAGFAAGATRCMLFTDLANPTSNALYPRLGYRPVGDAVDIAFID